jgi:hypothetical protein
LEKAKRKQQEKKWRSDEVKQFGMSIHGLRENGQFCWV